MPSNDNENQQDASMPASPSTPASEGAPTAQPSESAAASAEQRADDVLATEAAAAEVAAASSGSAPSESTPMEAAASEPAASAAEAAETIGHPGVAAGDVPEESAPAVGADATRTMTGVVISSRADKTISVRVERRVKHPVYGKFIRRSTKLAVHDEANECQEGDVVSIMQTRPISKTKSWTLRAIVERPVSIASGDRQRRA